MKKIKPTQALIQVCYELAAINSSCIRERREREPREFKRMSDAEFESTLYDFATSLAVKNVKRFLAEGVELRPSVESELEWEFPKSPVTTALFERLLREK